MRTPASACWSSSARPADTSGGCSIGHHKKAVSVDLGKKIRLRTMKPAGAQMHGLSWCICALVIAGAASAAQERPLPDHESFLKETRRHLQTDSTLQSSYVYVETRREQKLDKHGRISQESVKVLESYPGLPGEARWERLIAENGRPVPAEELAKQDRERQAKAAGMVKRLAEDGPKERARQEREYQKARRERDEAVSDVFTVFDIRMIGRERIEGHDTMAFLLTPRPAL